MAQFDGQLRETLRHVIVQFACEAGPFGLLRLKQPATELSSGALDLFSIGDVPMPRSERRS